MSLELKRNFILLILFLICFESKGWCASHVMPEELVADARSKGCDEIKNFFKLGGIQPPYQYGFLPGPVENSAAYFCQKNEGKQLSYWLMLFIKDATHGLTRCPPLKLWQVEKNPSRLHRMLSRGINFFSSASGYSLNYKVPYVPNPTNLSQFYTVEPIFERSILPGPLKYPGIILQSNMNPETAMFPGYFYCHKEEWYIHLAPSED